MVNYKGMTRTHIDRRTLRDDLIDLVAWAELASLPASNTDHLGVTTSTLSDPTASAAMDETSARVRSAMAHAERVLAKNWATNAELAQAADRLSVALRGEYQLVDTATPVASRREAERALQTQLGLWESGQRATKPRTAPNAIRRQDRQDLIAENDLLLAKQRKVAA